MAAEGVDEGGDLALGATRGSAVWLEVWGEGGEREEKEKRKERATRRRPGEREKGGKENANLLGEQVDVNVLHACLC